MNIPLFFICAALAFLTVRFGHFMARRRPIPNFQHQLTALAYRNLMFVLAALSWFLITSLSKEKSIEIFLGYFFCYLALILVDTAQFISRLKKH